MKSMNRKENKKIAVMAAVIMGFMVIAFMPLASAGVTSFTVSPATGTAGAVASYDVFVITDGVTSINITMPAGFIAVAPTTGGVEIARVDFWNSSTKAYYGHAIITANDTNPTTKAQNVNYAPGATNTFESGFGDGSLAIIKLPTGTVGGSIEITINSTAFLLDAVMTSIKQFVRNPLTPGDYVFSADGVDETVTITGGFCSAVFRSGQWFIDETGNQKTDKYFVYGWAGCIPVVGEFGSNDYGVFYDGKWYIDTTGNQKTNLHFGYGTTGDKPVVGNFGGDDGYGVFRNGRWYIDTTGNQKTNLCFWYGTTGDKPVVGNFGGDDGYGVFRDGRWYIDTTGNQKTNLAFNYGWAGCIPVVGDFNGDGTDDYGVFDDGQWWIDTTGDQKTNLHYWYGTVNDKPLFAGDIV
jgi:hypothetical protein